VAGRRLAWSSLCLTLVVGAMVAGTAGLSPPASAQPAPGAHPLGGVVVSGDASISYAASTTTVAQSSQRAVVDWQSVNVGSQQVVDIVQPSRSSVTLLVQTGPNASQLAGRIESNGAVYLVNPDGIHVDAGAEINTSGLILSSDGITATDFMSGAENFDQPPSPSAEIVVASQSTITELPSSFSALLGPDVHVNGTITLKLGNVDVVAADAASFGSEGGIDVSAGISQVPAGVAAPVGISGQLQLAGTYLRVVGAANAGLFATLVHVGGSISDRTGLRAGAVSVDGIGGSVLLDGTIAAKGGGASPGGSVQVITSNDITAASGASINASGGTAGGVVALGTSSADARATPCTAPEKSDGTLVDKGASLLANATNNGNGGTVQVLSTGTTAMDGAVYAEGGPSGGNGGEFVLGGAPVSIAGSDNVSAPKGTVGSVDLC
jgi:filamentous hemagglutinin family protein